MCNIVCRLTPDAKTVKAFKEKIDDEYRVNMYGTDLLGHLYMAFYFCENGFEVSFIINLPSILQDSR